MSDDDDAVRREREMQEHEREARERDPAEQSPEGSEAEDASGDRPAPPGDFPSTTGQP